MISYLLLFLHLLLQRAEYADRKELAGAAYIATVSVDAVVHHRIREPLHSLAPFHCKGTVIIYGCKMFATLLRSMPVRLYVAPPSVSLADRQIYGY